jgi:hypothetical protein
MKTLILKYITQGRNLVKSLGIVGFISVLIVFPFVLTFQIIGAVLYPLAVFAAAVPIFVYIALSALAPNLVNTVLNWIEMPIKRLRAIASFEPHFALKKDNKSWIKSLYPKGTRAFKRGEIPGREPRISNEFRRFASIVVWLFNCKDLRPHFVTFLARVERMIQVNGSTYTFSYLKEAMRILVRALAGTPHLKSAVKPGMIRMRLDHYGLPTIFPLQLRNYLREFIRAYNYSESGQGFELKVQSDFHPNRWEDATLPYHTKKIVAVLSLAGIFRVLKTNVKADLSTIIAPFDGQYSTLPMPLIREALSKLSSSTTKREVMDWSTGGTKTEYREVKGADLYSVVNTGRFNPHFSAKSGPNGSLSTWSAALDAIAFMHEPLKALKLIGWMLDQRAYGYVLWFVLLNVVFGLPYIF